MAWLTGLALLAGLVATVAFGRAAFISSPQAAAPQTLDRASAVNRAVHVVVDAGAAGARSDAALRSVQRTALAASADPSFKRLLVSAARQQRLALLADAPRRATILERTVPVGYQLTEFGDDRASVAVWTLQVAGPDAGRRAPSAWWLTTKVNLAGERGRWRVENAVAIQGPAPRLVRAQQAGLGSRSELRGMLQKSRSLHVAP